jgi:hypothetical protein
MLDACPMPGRSTIAPWRASFPSRSIEGRAPRPSRLSVSHNSRQQHPNETLASTLRLPRSLLPPFPRSPPPTLSPLAADALARALRRLGASAAPPLPPRSSPQCHTMDLGLSWCSVAGWPQYGASSSSEPGRHLRHCYTTPFPLMLGEDGPMEEVGLRRRPCIQIWASRDGGCKAVAGGARGGARRLAMTG